MVLDDNLKLYSNDTTVVNVNTALSNTGNAVVIGNTGVHRNAAFICFVGTADATRDLSFALQLTEDGTNYNTIATVTFKAGFKGEKASGISLQDAWERYTQANIKVRCTVTSANDANAGNWGRTRAYIGQNEGQVYGRKANADTLANY